MRTKPQRNRPIRHVTLSQEVNDFIEQRAKEEDRTFSKMLDRIMTDVMIGSRGMVEGILERQMQEQRKKQRRRKNEVKEAG